MTLRALQLLDLAKPPGNAQRFTDGKDGISAVRAGFAGTGEEVGQKVAGIGHGIS
jgi:hypothetical protein